MTDLHIEYRIGLSTISAIVREVCGAIWKTMRHICFPELTEEVFVKSAQQFEMKTQFPLCAAAIDGKHIRTIKPKDSGSLNFNYKNYFSTILLAMCDADYKFLYIDVGSYGKSSDSTIFQNSLLHQKLVNNEIKLPQGCSLTPGSDVLPFVILGDEGFGLSKYIMRPYGGKFLPLIKRVFNYRLSRARRFIECTFGILANKWRIFHRPLNVEQDLAELIIKVCCLLHNFVRERDGFRFEDTLTVDGFDEMQCVPRMNPGRTATTVREHFANYFMSAEGQLPFQFTKC